MSQDEKTLEFIAKARKVHGDTYGYEKSKYTLANNKIIITCKIHGDFEIRASHLTEGQGCKRCSLENKRLKFEKIFIEKAKKIHGNQYDYSKFKYTKESDKATFICKKCNQSFKQRIQAHLNGHGCRKCNPSKINRTKEQFVNNAIKIHKNKYDYSKSAYVDSKTKILIFCNCCKKSFIKGQAITFKEVDARGVPDILLLIKLNS